MKVLCFQPHNDDCAIAIGGTMQKMLRQGWELTYVYVTDGRHGSDVVPSEELIGIRRGEAAEERILLGIHHFVELGVEDGSLGKLRGLHLESVKQQIASTLVASKADLILLPTRSDMHPDHRASCDLVVRVMEDMKLTPLLVKYFVWLFPDFYKKLPDISERVLMVGIDREMTRKMAAIRLHQSQVSKGSFDSMVQTLNAYLAYAFRAPATIGARYVEIVGLAGSGRRARKTKELLRALEPCADITDMFHGRPSQRIRARL
jgi:LmbE family N-acetylglucosaminyl deacetylase